MEPLTVLLIVVVLALALAWAGHVVAKYTWPTRRRLWRRRAILVEEEAREYGTEYDLEKPEAGINGDYTDALTGQGVVYDAQAGEIEAVAEPAQAAPGGEPVPGEDPLQDDAQTRLRARRAAGTSQEDLDY
jgi:hypothetical protein